MKKILTSIVVLLITLSGFSQSKRELIDLGDQAYNKGNFGSAIYYYLKIVEGGKGGKYDITHPYEINTYINPISDGDSSNQTIKTPSDDRKKYVIHKIADSYRKLKDYDNSVRWYEKAIVIPLDEFPNVAYWYGSSLMKIGAYDRAKNVFQNFTNSIEENDPFLSLAEDKLIACQFAKNPENTKSDIIVTEMDSIFNNGTSSFAANYYEGELSLMFTSARSTSTVINRNANDPRYFADIFITQNVGNGWEPAVKMEAPISSGMHEGSSAISTDRTTFYFTRWDNEDKTNCHIYVSKKFNGQWLVPLKLNILNMEGYRSMNPFLSLDESTIYFVSDMPGGEGGLDIWAAPIDNYANIGKPYNLGPVVNTKEDEMSPFHHYQSNTLYYSSEGKIGFGGMDVFRTKFNADDELWGQPVNLGAPINSSKDDTYYILDVNQKYGFITSDRVRCKDCDSTQLIQGHCNKIYSIERPELQFSINGFVFEDETGEPISNSLVTFKDIRGVWPPFFVMTNDEGYYEKELEANMEIFMKAQKSKFFGDAATTSTMGLTESTVLTQDFFLSKIPDQAIEISGIEYDFDKATLRPKSKEILDELVEFLELNDNLNIEIQSHTDFRGDDDYNMELSQRRAKSVVDYLVDNGLSRERLSPNGYGETEPAIQLDEDGKPIKDANGEFKRLSIEYIQNLPTSEERIAANQRNRRTSFKVLSENNEVLQQSNNQ